MFKKIRGNEFNRNVLKLMTGTTLAQAVPILLSPILTRLYTPEDFGVLTLFLAITAIFGSIINGRYELAIVLPDDDDDAINLAALSLFIAVIMSFLLMIVILIFHADINNIIGNDGISFWLYFAPLIIFLIGLFNVLKYINTRFKTYGLLAKVNVIRALSTGFIQVILGLFKLGSNGLIIGQFISYVISNRRLSMPIIKDKALIKKIKMREMWIQAKRYSNFPKYSMMATLANTLGQQMISFIIPILYSVNQLGQYGIVNRVMAVPSNVIGSSFGQVFFQEASSERQKTGKAINTFKSTVIKMFILSIPIFIIIYFFIEKIIVLVFGPSWIEAGVYAKILTPMFFIRFVNTPLSTITSVYEKNQIALLLQIFFLIINIIIFSISMYFKLNIINFMMFYSCSIFIFNLIRLSVFYKISRGD